MILFDFKTLIQKYFGNFQNFINNICSKFENNF